MTAQNSQTKTSAKAPGYSLESTREARRFLRRCYESRWQKYRKSLKRARKDISEGSIHELRIDTRRMLALFELMERFCPREHLGEAQRRLNKFFKASGLLRDVQVQQCMIRKAAKRFPELAAFQKWLGRREKRLACRFEKNIARGAKPKLKAELAALGKWLRQSVREKEIRGLDARIFLSKVRARYKNISELREAVRANRPSTIHCLRIAFKAYRYMVEIIEPELVKIPMPLMTQLREYQALMGDIQDAEVLLARVAKFETKSDTRLASFRAELKRRHAELIKRFLATPFPQAISAKEDAVAA
jgi:CHAD domain-containing protein